MKNLLLGLAVLSCSVLVANQQEIRRLNDAIKAREAAVNQHHEQNAVDRAEICRLESMLRVSEAESRERADGRYSKPAPITRHAAAPVSTARTTRTVATY